jgi:DNA-binding NtrC family response regulator
MGSKKVLIVEDEPDLSAVFANLLKVFGVESEIADTAENAKEKINKNKYDFYIIDITLPDISGIELYKDMIELNPECRGNVIFTSGLNESEELLSIIKSDGTSFLPKPFSMEKLREALNRWL